VTPTPRAGRHDARNLAEARVDGQRLVEATEAALAENGALLLSPKNCGGLKIAWPTSNWLCKAPT
jgi:hypothetical protein